MDDQDHEERWEGIDLDDWSKWKCSCCGYSDRGPLDSPVGESMEVEVEKGREKKTVDTVVCPACKSEHWYLSAFQRSQLGI